MTECFFVYVLRCADDTLYTGFTNDLNRRLAEHQAGKGAKYTRGRRPVALVRSWSCPDRLTAMRIERRIKNLARSKKLSLLAEGASSSQAHWPRPEGIATVQHRL